MNSVARPHKEVAIAMVIKYCNFSLEPFGERATGNIKSNASKPKMPVCTHLSKWIKLSRLLDGISSPGKHISTNTTMNQAMAGINLEMLIRFIYTKLRARPLGRKTAD